MSCGYLAFPFDVLQVIFSYLIDNINMLQDLRYCVESASPSMDVNLLFHYSLKDILCHICDVTLYPQQIRFTEDEIVLLTQRTTERGWNALHFLFYCARKGIFSNLTKSLISQCSFDEKLNALKLALLPSELSLFDVSKYEITLSALVSDLWRINARETRSSVDRHLRSLRNNTERLLFKGQFLTDRILTVVAKFDKQIFLRHARYLPLLVSYYYLKRLVHKHQFKPKELLLQMSWRSVQNDQSLISKFLFLLEQGAKWESFVHFRSLGEGSMDVFFTQIITRLPDHSCILSKGLMYWMIVRIQQNSSLFDLFVNSHVLRHAQHEPRIANLLKSKDIQNLHKLYKNILDFYFFVCDKCNTWREVFEKVIPQLEGADWELKLATKRAVYYQMDPTDEDDTDIDDEDDSDDLLDGWVRPKRSLGYDALMFKQFLTFRADVLNTYLENQENVQRVEHTVCSRDGLDYLEIMDKRTPQLKMIFNSISSSGKTLFLKTLSTARAFDWVDYLLD